jgi:cytidyltransferase-like protein
MAGINHLREVYEKKGEEFLNGLLNNYVIINEKVDGTFFGVKKSKDDSFRYFKKSGEITYVDRVLMKYFNPAISHIESISPERRNRIPSNFYFGFEYFTRGDSKNSRYDRLPKSGLVLSYIHRLNDKGEIESTVQNKELLDRWADYLDVERPPILFEGHLTDEQKTAILEFVYSPAKELTDKFKTTSFTKHILSVLKDGEATSFLKDGKGAGIETIVFRFYDETKESPKPEVFLAKIVDPIFQERAETAPKTKENPSQDYIWLIVIDLMNHFETYDVEELRKLVDSNRGFEENYIAIINTVFKDFIKEYAQKYEGLLLEVPEYLKRPEFELDKNLVGDKWIVNAIKKNETYAEIYKILLNFFRKTRKRSSSGFFTPNLLTQLNIIVTKLRNIIMGDAVYEGLFPSFSQFIGAPIDEPVLSEAEHARAAHLKKEPIEVNLLIGSFQPVTIGHIKAAQKLKDKNGKPVVFIAIKPDRQSKKSPFSLKQTRIMLEKVQQEYNDLIRDVRLIRGGQIEDVVRAIQPDYSPVLWGTSEKRVKDHALQMDYIKKRNVPLRLSSDFKMVELPSFIKSEDVVSSILASDFAKFKKEVPDSIASEFFNLQKELESQLSEQKASSTGFKSLFEDLQVSAEIVDPKLREEDQEGGKD